jgi:hypothetical protein
MSVLAFAPFMRIPTYLHEADDAPRAEAAFCPVLLHDRACSLRNLLISRPAILSTDKRARKQTPDKKRLAQKHWGHTS